MSSASPRGLTALLLAIGLLVAGEAAARELRVCADPNNLPFSDAAGRGFENGLVSIIAEELKADVRYVWWAQRRGFIRNTLKAGLCDLVPGIASNIEMLRTTEPYYRSTYVFVSRAADRLDIASLDDPRLNGLTIGVQLIGDDGANTPPAEALARRGLSARLRGFPVYGNYGQAEPARPIIDAVASGAVDIAVVWGPTAGFFARSAAVPLRLQPVTPQIDGPMLPMVFDVSLGLRKEDDVLRGEVERALRVRRADIDRLLDGYGVPRVDTVAAGGSR
jgi:mxaJ protein